MAALSTGNGLADVVVTAVASTTSVAVDTEDTWQGLLAGRSGIRTLDDPFIDEFDSPVRIGGRLRESFEEQVSRIERRRMGFMQQMSVVLGRRAWEAAGSPEVDTRRLAISIGQAFASTEQLVFLYDAFKRRGMGATTPLAVQMHMPNAPAAVVGLDHGAKAGIMAPVLADASGAAAIGWAWRHLVLGEADIAICGGVEARIEAVPLGSFAAHDLLSTNNDDPTGACRPFDEKRDGMVLGEGGALMVIETEAHANARGAPILARLMGAATTSDGYDIVQPDPAGERAGDAITRAIALAGLTPADIDHVNAHGTGVAFGDLAESCALHHAFGAYPPPVYAAKAALGHSMGAAGAVEAVLTVQALRDQIVPATLNLENIDREINLDVVAEAPRPGKYRYAVKDGFSFGGQNVALVFGAY